MSEPIRDMIARSPVTWSEVAAVFKEMAERSAGLEAATNALTEAMRNAQQLNEDE